MYYCVNCNGPLIPIDTQMGQCMGNMLGLPAVCGPPSREREAPAAFVNEVNKPRAYSD